MRRFNVTVLAIALALALVSCGGDDSTPTTAAPGTTGASVTTAGGATTTAGSADGIVRIDIASFSFSPAEVTVSVGTTVEWTNRDNTDHTTTADGGVWNGSLAPDATFQYVADTPGEFAYVCNIHMGMAGVLTVEG